MTKETKRWAQVNWGVEDILARYDVTEEQAAEILTEVEDNIRDTMITTGWEAIDDLEYENVLRGRYGMRRHTCMWCADRLEEFTVDDMVSLPGGQKFCSEDCRDAWRRDDESRREPGEV